jgi:hypothetical protein
VANVTSDFYWSLHDGNQPTTSYPAEKMGRNDVAGGFAPDNVPKKWNHT